MNFHYEFSESSTEQIGGGELFVKDRIGFANTHPTPSGRSSATSPERSILWNREKRLGVSKTAEGRLPRPRYRAPVGRALAGCVISSSQPTETGFGPRRYQRGSVGTSISLIRKSCSASSRSIDPASAIVFSSICGPVLGVTALLWNRR